MTEPGRLSPADIAQLFAPLSPFRSIVLAVSGGSDSVALMHLAALWTASLAERSPVVEVATVDHGLRPGSSAEAARVGGMARELGLAHRTLTWNGEKPGRAVQKHAREARYRLLSEAARRTGVVPAAVVTAHTSDDQAETVLMRLARGSGPDGLAGMAAVRPLEPGGSVCLVRPLLDVARADLRAWLNAHGIAWLDDPSNEDRRFERTRLRAAAPALHGLGLTPRMLALAAGRQRRAVAALERTTDALLTTAVDLNGGAFAGILGTAYAAAPEDIRVRLLTRLLGMFGGAAPRAELAEVERLATALAGAGPVRATLGGCAVRTTAREIRIFREAGRAVLPQLALAPGETMRWDDRFLIAHAPGPAGLAVTVRALDPALYAELRRRASPRPSIPSRAAATLPAVWAGDRLVAVGSLRSSLLAALGPHLTAAAPVEARFLFDNTSPRS